MQLLVTRAIWWAVRQIELLASSFARRKRDYPLINARRVDPGMGQAITEPGTYVFSVNLLCQ